MKNKIKIQEGKSNIYVKSNKDRYSNKNISLWHVLKYVCNIKKSKCKWIEK